MSTEFSQLLTFHNVRYLFNATFQAALSLVSVHVGKIALTLCVLALVHLVVVYRRTYNTVSYFQRGIFWARWIHTVANIWLISPLTRTPNNSHLNDDSAEECSLLFLHRVQKVFLVVSCRIYLFALHTGSAQWPWRLHLYFDPIFLAMLFGVMLHQAYHSKVKLDAPIWPNFLGMNTTYNAVSYVWSSFDHHYAVASIRLWAQIWETAQTSQAQLHIVLQALLSNKISFTPQLRRGNVNKILKGEGEHPDYHPQCLTAYRGHFDRSDKHHKALHRYWNPYWLWWEEWSDHPLKWFWRRWQPNSNPSMVWGKKKVPWK